MRWCLRLFWLPVALLAILSCDNNSGRFADRTIVCFCFDDEHESAYTVAFPVMQEYGFTGTMVVNSGWLGNTGRMTWNQLDEMVLENGWELAGHTRHHVNLATCSYEEAWDEVVGEFELYTDMGYEVTMFALPAGEASTRDFEIISECYETIRTSRDITMKAPVNPHYLGYFSYWTEYEPEQVYQRIQMGMKDQEDLIILGFHSLKDPDEGALTNCSPDDFRAIVEYISKLDVEVMTIREAVRLLKK